MTKVPWQGKEGESDHKVFVATKPGQIVSVDQMISTQVGFIAQLKGGLTRQRYTAATVFMDHYSRLQYIHLMTCLTLQETFNAKRAFEHFAKQHGM
jgi:predicted patatin/cPLA2 family phospholipase